MFKTIKTLISGANARAEEELRDVYSIELIDQKIREAQSNMKAAKLGLASLIQRQRTEQRQLETVTGRIADLTDRAAQALEGGREDLAFQAAQAIADLQNETASRAETVARLDTRIVQLRASVDTGHRRLLDLQQGAVQARASRREQGLQRKLNLSLGGENPMDETDALIRKVLGGDDPFEETEILRGIEQRLNHAGAADNLAQAGFGAPIKATAQAVLDNLKSAQTRRV